MLISQVPQNPLDDQSLSVIATVLTLPASIPGTTHLTPYDIVCFWDKVKVLKARAVEAADPGVPVQVLDRLLQEVLVLLQQVYSLKVLKRDHVK